ncbi:MAG TPA: ABC transporter substrate-binding protein [Terriglobia bacterium]|jgi:ABC-type branched-subunit amino acid transport system substrate-binding protein
MSETAISPITRRLFLQAAGLCCGWAAVPSFARGTGDRSEIVIGMSAALSGPSARLGKGMKLGMDSFIKRANDAGGIGGRRLRLVVLDDSYQAEPVRANMERLIDAEHVLAVVGSVGTAGAGVAVPIANDRHVLLFGAFSGAAVLRKTPPDRYVINLRASYAEETAVMVRGLLKKGVKPQQIAFFTQDDAYGDSGYAGAVKAIEALGYDETRSLAHGRYARGTLDIDDGLLAIIQARTRPHAVIMVGSYAPCAKFIKLARQLLPNGLFLNVSFVGSEALTEALGADGEGVIVSQVVPHYNTPLPGTMEYRAALERYAPGSKPDFVSLEGYLVMKAFSSGLARVTAAPTREAIVDALEHAGTVNIGIGVPLHFAPEEHQGSHHIWMTEIRGGALVPIENW